MGVTMVYDINGINMGFISIISYYIFWCMGKRGLILNFSIFIGNMDESMRLLRKLFLKRMNKIIVIQLYTHSWCRFLSNVLPCLSIAFPLPFYFTLTSFMPM